MNTLPEVNTDPNIERGRQAQIDYDRTIAKIRTDPRLSDLAKAEQIDAAWSTYNSTIADAETKFYSQRAARLQSIEALVPIGPNVSPDTPRADAAVLHQSFSAAYTAALEAGADELAQRFTQADRFGDDMTARAVLTAASDRGIRPVLDLWAAQDPNRSAALREAGQLRELLSGHGTDSRFANQAFGYVLRRTKPRESHDLGSIREQVGG